MAKEMPSSTEPPKLSRISKGQKIKKGSLLHPPVAGRRTGSTTQKVVYVSPSSPFVSIIKRAKTYLREIENRSSPAISLARSSDHELLKTIEASVINAAKGKREEVTVTGTGRAIDKVLQVGCWFGNEGEGKLWKVEWRTGSIGAVDEVINEDGQVDEERRERRTGSLEAIISAR